MAIRGLLVQTLVALLEVIDAHSSFTEIILEPAIGNEQFDFLWKDAHGSHATQVKSTINTFTKADVMRWAARLRNARTNERCRLVLVGNTHPSLDGIGELCDVTIERRTLDLGGLIKQAAQEVAAFLENNDKFAGTAQQRIIIVHALIAKLEHHSVDSKPLSRDALIALLTHWIYSTPVLSLSSESAKVDLEQEQRIRDFVKITRNALANFKISLKKKHAAEWEALKQMKNGLHCTPGYLNTVGRGLWKLVSDITAKGGRHENFDIFWETLLNDLRRRFLRCSTDEQWTKLQQVLDHPDAQEEPKWNEFLARWVHPPLVVLDEKSVLDLVLYRKDIEARCRELSLSGFGGLGAQSEAEGKAELSNVYIDLDTKVQLERLMAIRGTKQRRTGAPREPVLRRLASSRRLVLIGLPGSGKSTLLKYFSLCLAQCGLKAGPEWRQCLKGWPEEEMELVPIFVELRKFAARQPTPLPPVDMGKPLTDYIRFQLESYGLGKSEDALVQALMTGQAILFLDGLDEVPDGVPDGDAQRRFVLDTLMAFSSGRFRECRMVVTCRPRSYDEPAWQLTDFEQAELAPLDPVQIARFIERFYAEVARRDLTVAEVERDREVQLVDALRRDELQGLASNPLMLTVMAWLHRFEKLPEKRANILNKLVEQLLYKWEERKRRDDKASGDEHATRTLTELLKPCELEIAHLRRVLCRVAFFSREVGASPRTGRPANLAISISKDDLRHELEKLIPPNAKMQISREHWSLEVCHVIDTRTGLLVPEGKQLYIMPYKLQEFLAGEYLTNNDELEIVGEKLLLEEPWTFDRVADHLVSNNGYWDEVVKWAAAVQTHVKLSNDQARKLAWKLCANPDPSYFSLAKLRRAVIAAEILVEIGLNEVAIGNPRSGPDCIQRAQKTLDGFMYSKGLPPSQRAVAGAARGWLKDFPEGVGLNDKGLPNIMWVNIGPGEFLMGDKGSWKEGKKPKATWIDQYRISRHLVTVAQYQAFVDDGGYKEEGFWKWSPESSQWFDAMREFCRRQNRMPGPENYERVFQTPNHPRVGVSWFEAMSFCKWLNRKLGIEENSLLLPSEAHWERTIRGSGDSPLKSEEYHSRMRSECNTDQSQIGHTSAVGLFPGGDTQKENGNEWGVSDLTGNAWEWTRTLWSEDLEHQEVVIDQLPVGRVLISRGGSWRFGEFRFPRLISPLRRGFAPHDRYDDLGFRLVYTGDEILDGRNERHL